MDEAVSRFQPVSAARVVGSNALGNMVEFGVRHYRIPIGYRNSLGDCGSASSGDNAVQFCLQNVQGK